MSDLERRLEDLFMHDSRTRRVTSVSVPARRRGALRGIAFAGAAALAVVALVVALNTLGGPPVTSPTSPTTSALPSTSPGATASAEPSASAAATRPDGRHGFLSQVGSTGRGLPETVTLRTEENATPLAQLPSLSGAAVSPDGHRLAMVRNTESGAQLVWGDTTRFGDAKVAVDLSGSGERSVGIVVWAADNSNNIAFAVSKPGAQQGIEPPPLYAALRSVDLETGAVIELARTSNEFVLVPLIWRPRDNLVVGFETGPGGYAASYVVVRGGQMERTVFDRDQPTGGLQADRAGARVLGLVGSGNDRFIRWWAWDRPDQPRELRAPAGETFLRAHWRPGSDEIGVEIVSSAPTPVPLRGRFELWSVTTDARRVVIANDGFEMFRQDGTAAIGQRGFAAPFEMYLIDLGTGTTTPIPRAGETERALGVAVLF